MLRQVFLTMQGMVAAFDENQQQVPEAQGSIVDFYYQLMKERGLADGNTVFDSAFGGLHQETGDMLDKAWRATPDDPTL